MIASKNSQGTKRRGALLRWIGLTLLFIGTHVLAQTTGTVTYVYTDPQGTHLAEADASGNITATFDYTPYGTSALGTPPNGPGYTGHVNDPETNLVYMQARYYDPATGRFLSIDPISLAEGDAFNFNRYAYASNNPIINIDPDGMADCAADQNGNGGACPPPQPTPQSQQSTTQPKTLPAVTVTATRPADAYPEEINIPTVSLTLVRSVTGIGLFLMDANGVHDMIFGKQGCYGDLSCQGLGHHIVQMANSIKGSKPKNAPPGTMPIDKSPGLSKDDIHTIKDGVGAGPQDWTGIAPNGDVITGDHEGNAVNNGPKSDYLPGSN